MSHESWQKQMQKRLGKGGLGITYPDDSTIFSSLSEYSRVVAKLSWDAEAIDFTPDARAWPRLPAERRDRLMTLLAGFRVAEDAVAEHLTPFADTTENLGDSMLMWVFFLQRRDEVRHARLFDRIAQEVLQLPGDTPDARRTAARAYVPASILELFEVTLPNLTAELAAGDTDLENGIGLYHMLLEGVVFSAGQRALLDDLADEALPGTLEGVRRVELDERWHVGFGVRCLTKNRPDGLIEDLVSRAEYAAQAWGDVVPDETRERAAALARRRLGLIAANQPQPAVSQPAVSPPTVTEPEPA